MRLKLVFFSFLIFSQSIFAQRVLSLAARVDSLFAKYTPETPGLAVAVVKNGAIIYKKGYGSANLEYSIPINPQSVFLVGSVSKQFTAFSIYLLEAQGKLSLTDDIRKYLPEVPDFGQPITIQHLLNHTSGLKEEIALLNFAGWRVDEYITIEHTLKLLSRQTDLNFTPGSAFKYSNTNYSLLGEIVKRVAGESFATFTKRNIFEPLGMDNSQFYDDHERLIKQRAYSYDLEDGVYRKSKLHSERVGSTGLYSTVEDLAKWNANFYHPKVGNKALLKKFNAVATLDNGAPAFLNKVANIRHTKGQFLSQHRGFIRYIHTGSHAGYKAFLGRFPEKEFAVILLSNDGYFNAYPTGNAIAEYFLDKEMTSKKTNTPKSVETKEKTEPVFDTDLSQYIGTYYSSELLSTYNLSLKNNQLVMTHLRLGEMPLTQIDQEKFSGRNYYPFKLAFIKNDNNRVIGYNIIDFRGELLKFNKR